MFSLRLFLDISSDYCNWQIVHCGKRGFLQKYMTMKKFYSIIAFCLIFTLVLVILLVMRCKSFKGYLQVIAFILLFMELSIVYITFVACVYLSHFFQSMSRMMANKWLGGAA